MAALTRDGVDTGTMAQVEALARANSVQRGETAEQYEDGRERRQLVRDSESRVRALGGVAPAESAAAEPLQDGVQGSMSPPLADLDTNVYQLYSLEVQVNAAADGDHAAGEAAVNWAGAGEVFAQHGVILVPDSDGLQVVGVGLMPLRPRGLARDLPELEHRIDLMPVSARPRRADLMDALQERFTLTQPSGGDQFSPEVDAELESKSDQELYDLLQDPVAEAAFLAQARLTLPVLSDVESDTDPEPVPKLRRSSRVTSDDVPDELLMGFSRGQARAAIEEGRGQARRAAIDADRLASQLVCCVCHQNLACKGRYHRDDGQKTRIHAGQPSRVSEVDEVPLQPVHVALPGHAGCKCHVTCVRSLLNEVQLPEVAEEVALCIGKPPGGYPSHLPEERGEPAASVDTWVCRCGLDFAGRPGGAGPVLESPEAGLLEQMEEDVPGSSEWLYLVPPSYVKDADGWPLVSVKDTAFRHARGAVLAAQPNTAEYRLMGVMMRHLEVTRESCVRLRTYLSDNFARYPDREEGLPDMYEEAPSQLAAWGTDPRHYDGGCPLWLDEDRLPQGYMLGMTARVPAVVSRRVQMLSELRSAVRHRVRLATVRAFDCVLEPPDGLEDEEDEWSLKHDREGAAGEMHGGQAAAVSAYSLLRQLGFKWIPRIESARPADGRWVFTGGQEGLDRGPCPAEGAEVELPALPILYEVMPDGLNDRLEPTVLPMRITVRQETVDLTSTP